MPQYAVINDRYKLIHFFGIGQDYTEFFDRQRDPHEMKSQFNNPEYASVIKGMKVEMERLRQELKVPIEFPSSAFGKKSNQKKEKATKSKEEGDTNE